MIYNGTWDNINLTCANSGDNVVAGKSAFNNGNRQAISVGYTYNSVYASNIETNRIIADLYGTDTDYLNNSTNSVVKKYLENTWYPKVMGDKYDGMFESSAGYCNDRSVYDENYELQDENVISMAQYSADTVLYYYGAYIRNATTAQNPSLHCPRSTADLYTAKDAINGNKQLSRPVALLTADEASFMGVGQCWNSSGGSNYSYYSYLVNVGTSNRLLSGFARRSSGIVSNYRQHNGGCITNNNDPVDGSVGVRPVVSLKPGILVLDGSGTATSPWTIE